MYLRIVFFYCILAYSSIAQTNMRYLEYLYQEKEYSLLHHEITQIYQRKDSLTHEEQSKICTLQYKIQDTVNPYFLPIFEKALKVKKRQNFIPSTQEEQYLHALCVAYSIKKSKDILPVYAYKDTFLIRQHNTLIKIEQEYIHQPKKSGFLAGFMSAVVPGLGKVYTGKPVQMIAPLLSTLILTAQAVEIAIKSGYHQLAFWIPVSISSVFYLSNIYGSYVSAKRYNTQLKQHYHAQLDNLLDIFVTHYSQR